MKNLSLNEAFKGQPPSSAADNMAQDINPPFKIVGDERTQARITDMINQIAVSETGRKTLETASKAGYKIGMEFVLGSNGGCSKEEKQIVLSPLSKDDILVGVLIHEARHAGQFERGEYDASDDRRPRRETLMTNIMRTRAVEADAQATAAQVLGEMMEAGNEKPLFVFARANAAIGRAFNQAMYDENALENGKARTAAFLAWYENDSIKKAYDEAYQVEMMTRRAEKGLNGEDTYDRLQTPAQIVKELCLDDKGGCYFTENPSLLASGSYIAVDRDTASVLNGLMKTAAPARKENEGNLTPFTADMSKTLNPLFVQARKFSR